MEAATTAPVRRRRHLGLYILGIIAVAIIAVVTLWNWDWLLPIVEAQASTALGRKVTAQHMHVQLGRTTTVALDGVQVANPDGFPADKPFAQIAKLTVAADVMAYVHGRHIVIPQIIVDQPVIEADQDAGGNANWNLATSGGASADPNAGPKIGQLVINDGHAHVAIAKLKADMNLDIATRQQDQVAAGDQQKAAANGGEIVVGAKGTYAGQPIEGQLVGGALLSLRDAANPYPVNLKLANGATHVSLAGTVQNPLNFAGANLKLELSGPDMSKLTPLTGVPIPETPSYSIAGKLDYADQKIRFTGFTGRLGSSDLNGDIIIDPTRARPFVDANLFSKQVDLPDLGGFLGSAPGRKQTPGQSPQQRAEITKAEASSKLLPDTPINLPKVNAADVRLRYKGAHIEGRSVPLDNIVVALDINEGRIQLHPVSFAVGTGQIVLNADLKPVGNEVAAKADISFQRVDLGRLMAATHLVNGGGTISGTAQLDSTGNSLASLLGHGNGGLRIGMAGGDISALLVDLSGLQFGNALMSALGLPTQAKVRCFIGDFTLQKGVVNTRTLLLDTSEARVQGTGTINLAAETINYKLETDSRHFSVGTLKTPIDVTGALKSPSIAPETGPLAVRGGLAAGLGVLFPPAALLPTIQLGVGEDNACQMAEAPIARSPEAKAPAVRHGPVQHRPVRRPATRR
jgi:AsmA family protein